MQINHFTAAGRHLKEESSIIVHHAVFCCSEHVTIMQPCCSLWPQLSRLQQKIVSRAKMVRGIMVKHKRHCHFVYIINIFCTIKDSNVQMQKSEYSINSFSSSVMLIGLGSVMVWSEGLLCPLYIQKAVLRHSNTLLLIKCFLTTMS